jgi:transposase
MGDVITIGIDLAKSVFQVHGVDAEGAVVVRRQLRRRQVLPFFEKLRPCLVGIEACATAHHWGREIERLGHRVRRILLASEGLFVLEVPPGVLALSTTSPGRRVGTSICST